MLLSILPGGCSTFHAHPEAQGLLLLHVPADTYFPVGLFLNCTFLVGEHTASRPALRLLGVVTQAGPGSGHLGGPLSVTEHGGGGRSSGGTAGVVVSPSRDAGVSQATPGAISPGEQPGRETPNTAGRRGAARPGPPRPPTTQRLCPAPRRREQPPGLAAGAKSLPGGQCVPTPVCLSPGAPHLPALRGSMCQERTRHQPAPSE